MESIEFDKISSSDLFFYHGQNDLGLECAHDLYRTLLQPKRSMFYNRSEGAGIKEHENYPNSLSLQIGLRFSIAESVSYNNKNIVLNENTKDRRLAVSQNSISFRADNTGNLDINVLFFMHANYEIPTTINLPIGVTK